MPIRHFVMSFAQAEGHLFRSTETVSSLRIAPIVDLNQWSGPAAVCGFIVAVVIDAIELVLFGRPSAHVLIERFKGTPTFTDANASASVKVEAFVFGIPASITHSLPYRIFRTTITKAVCAMTVSGRLVSNAATRSDVSREQIVAINDVMGSTTSTTTDPANTASVRSTLDDR